MIVLIFSTVLLISLMGFIPVESSSEEGKTWMDNVDDACLITSLSIPGTHDSGATHSIFDVAGKCQDTTITEQLNFGVRFLDIRLKLIEDELVIVHSFVDQKLTFEKVLMTITKYIKENPSEFLIVSIKEDDDALKPLSTFNEAVLKAINEYRDIIVNDNNLPNTVGEARGKIYLLSRFESTVGIPAYHGWKDSTSFNLDSIYIQDNYCIDDIEEKICDIKDAISYCNSNDGELVINFTSCYLDNASPPSYAASAAKRINPWFLDYVDDFEGKLGIVVMDFMSIELAESIYRRNY